MSAARTVLAFVIAALLASVPAASAQNLLANPTFDSDLSGWLGTSGKSWSSDDAAGSSSSGSLEIQLKETTSTTIIQCVPVHGGDAYEFGLDLRLTIQGDGSGSAGMLLRWMKNPECTTPSAEFPASTFTNFAPEWTHRDGAATAPDDAVAVLLELRASKTGGSAGARVTAHFDNAYFDEAGQSAPSTTTTLPASACGDPSLPFELRTATDALFILKASVEVESCAPCICDVNGSGDLSAADALLALRLSVGDDVEAACPACS